MFLLTLAVVAVIVAIALGRLPGGMPEPASTVPVVRLPSGPLTGAHVHELRFVPGLRGYRMDQVDDALDRLARELDQLRDLVPPDVLRAHDQNLSPESSPQPEFYLEPESYRQPESDPQPKFYPQPEFYPEPDSYRPPATFPAGEPLQPGADVNGVRGSRGGEL